jgi:hypothetical protein
MSKRNPRQAIARLIAFVTAPFRHIWREQLRMERWREEGRCEECGSAGPLVTYGRRCAACDRPEIF